MGRKSVNRGVSALGISRIQFDFEFEGVRYRPTLERAPTEANLRRARPQLQGIKERIAHGTFSFAEEFPEYRFRKHVASVAAARTCNDVFDEFLAHVDARVVKHDLAFATGDSYRKTLANVWRPKLGTRLFSEVRYSELMKIADAHAKSKKTYNNVVSVLRCAFDYGYRDTPEKHNPATGLKCLRITKKDRPVIDPFSIQEAEALITAIHRDWGEAQGNYDEFRFFTGLRPSEQIALQVGDCDIVHGKISVSKARVMARDKDRTKTSTDRLVELCPRALQVLKRHLALRARLQLAGKIQHDDLFFKETGEPIRNLQYPWVRWRSTLRRMKTRYRDAYNARHSSVSWNLMVGKNPLWVAKMHGHSVQTMLDTYAAWTEGAQESDVEAIRVAMAGAPERSVQSLPAVVNSEAILVPPAGPRSPLEAPEFGSRMAVEHPPSRASACSTKRSNGGERGIRTQSPGIRASGASTSAPAREYPRPDSHGLPRGSSKRALG